MDKIGEMAAAFNSPRTLKMVVCKACGKENSRFAGSCVNCGEPSAATPLHMEFRLWSGALILPLAVLLAAAVAVFLSPF
jgi:hypothetical protein